jgi:hypothetical protein
MRNIENGCFNGSLSVTLAESGLQGLTEQQRAEGRYTSMKLLMAGLLAFSGAGFAASITPVSYHDGILVSFSMPASVSTCTGRSEQSCSDVNRAQYVVKSEGVLYSLTPVSSATGVIAERATLGWSKALGKSSSLYRQEIGTALQLRDDGRHLFVKVGNRESKYTAVEAR